MAAFGTLHFPDAVAHDRISEGREWVGGGHSVFWSLGLESVELSDVHFRGTGSSPSSPCARRCAEVFTEVISFNPHNHPKN